MQHVAQGRDTVCEIRKYVIKRKPSDISKHNYQH